MKKKRSYWFAGKMRDVPIGWRRRDGFYSANVGKRNCCENFLIVVYGYSGMKKKRSYWLAGKMRYVPVG
jgi:hypothetical protein